MLNISKDENLVVLIMIVNKRIAHAETYTKK